MSLPWRGLLSCAIVIIASCRSAGVADVKDRDASRSSNRTQTAEIDKPWWRACRSNADCERDHVCIAVDKRPEQAMWLAPFPEPKACAFVMPRNLALGDAGDLEPRYRERLVLFPNIAFTLSLTTCTARACHYLNGAPVECCNRCEGEEVWLSGFAGVSIIAPDGKPLECADRMDCEPRSCPSWLKLDKDFEVAGAFHSVANDASERVVVPLRGSNGRLAFVLATDPERWSDPDW